MTRTLDAEVRAGARAILPVLLALIPAGIALGAAWDAAALPIGAGLLAAATVYGASAQLLVVELTVRDAGLVVVVVATAVVSLRLALLGAGLGRHLCGVRWQVRWVAALGLVDPVYLVVDQRFAGPGSPAARGRFVLGAAGTLWVGWQVAHGVGLVLGSVVPAALALDLALPLCLVGLLAPRLGDRPVRVAAPVAAVVAVASAGAPLGSGLVIALGAALLAGSRATARAGSRRIGAEAGR